MDTFFPEKIAEIKNFIDRVICEISHVDEIAEKFNVNRNCLHEWFKMTYGINLKEYILQKKFEKLIELISNDNDNKIVFYYANTLGFKTSSGLCNLIKRKTGLTFGELKESVKKNGIESYNL
jgi:two-component system response regulator YesN